MADLLKTFYGPETLNYKIFMAVNHAHHPILDPVMEACITLGSSRIVYWYAGLLLLAGMIRKGLMPFRYVWLYCMAVALSIGVEDLLKEFFHVPRPALAIGRDKILLLGEVKLKNGFPSGHATFSFLTAYFLGHRRRWPWKAFLYGFAILVAWSRLYVGAHYPLDVVGGALLGIFIGFVVWKLYEWWLARAFQKEAEEGQDEPRRDPPPPPSSSEN